MTNREELSKYDYVIKSFSVEEQVDNVKTYLIALDFYIHGLEHIGSCCILIDLNTCDIVLNIWISNERELGWFILVLEIFLPSLLNMEELTKKISNIEEPVLYLVHINKYLPNIDKIFNDLFKEVKIKHIGALAIDTLSLVVYYNGEKKREISLQGSTIGEEINRTITNLLLDIDHYVYIYKKEKNPDTNNLVRKMIETKNMLKSMLVRYVEKD